MMMIIISISNSLLHRDLAKRANLAKSKVRADHIIVRSISGICARSHVCFVQFSDGGVVGSKQPANITIVSLAIEAEEEHDDEDNGDDESARGRRGRWQLREA
eukprot:TRINITY_DN47446_c0_g1_i1.p1 TRINITY_DN47446_c0_g1~~TRINITY_DN47446_c0_g1_i1.p1  ORF type:complete len:103 (-),score=9.76 TRINITY_DN47446_c0_g1_i1:18-326(-)